MSRNNMECEWYNLEGFVDFLNKSEGSNYKLEKCLDIYNRNESEPEVLIKDFGTNDFAVIEKKRLYWPKNEGEIKGIESKFSELFYELMDSEMKKFRSNTFVLSIYDIITWKTRDFNTNVEIIVNDIKDNFLQGTSAGVPISKTTPIKWSFGAVKDEYKDIYNYNKGIGIEYHRGSVNFFGHNHDDKKIKDIIQKFYESAERKFINYHNYRRILLIKNLSIELTDHYLMDKIRTCNKPITINEVWLEVDDYIDDWTIQPKYIKIE